ncbi:MAG TPA: hypothetical protein VMG74_05200 [Gaiellaceae bacterium]|nr:hypothetical protein [Gaiellaceae bacterium]
MGTRPDPDLLLVERMLAPPPLEDARSSLEYWRRRRKTLPVYKRRARREAREMALRWDERVREAERLRFDSTVLGRILKAVGVSGFYRRNMPNTKWRLVSLGWALVPRNLKLVAGGLIAAWLFVLLGVVALAALVVHAA